MISKHSERHHPKTFAVHKYKGRLLSLPVLFALLWLLAGTGAGLWGNLASGAENTTGKNPKLREMPECLHLARFIPNNSFLFVHFPGSAALAGRIENTFAGKFLAKEETLSFIKTAWEDRRAIIDWLGKNDLLPEKISKNEKSDNSSGISSEHSQSLAELADIFCKGFTFATWPADNGKISFVILTVPGPQPPLERISTIAENFYKSSSIMSGGLLQISLTTPTGLTTATKTTKIYAAMAGDRLAVSDSPKIVEALRRHEPGVAAGGSILHNPAFTEGLTKTRLLRKSSFFWTIPNQLKTNWEPAFSKVNELPVFNSFAGFADADSISVAGGVGGNLITHTFCLKFTKKPAGIASIMRENTFGSRNPKPTDRKYQESAFTLNLSATPGTVYEKLLDILRENLSLDAQKRMFEVIYRCEHLSGLKFRRDLGRLLSGEITILPTSTNGELSVFPPKIAIIFEVTDHERVKSLLQNLCDASGGEENWSIFEAENADIFCRLPDRSGIPFAFSAALTEKSAPRLIIAPTPQDVRAAIQKSENSDKLTEITQNGAKNTDSPSDPKTVKESDKQFRLRLSAGNFAALYNTIYAASLGAEKIPGFRARTENLLSWRMLDLKEPDTEVTADFHGNWLTVRTTGPAGALSVPLWLTGELCKSLEKRNSAALLSLVGLTGIGVLEKTGKQENAQLSLKRLNLIYRATLEFQQARGKYPASLDDLMEARLLSAEDVLCPVLENKRYAYFPITGQIQPTRILAHEPLSRDAQGVQAIFQDGRVEWISRLRLQKITGLLPQD